MIIRTTTPTHTFYSTFPLLEVENFYITYSQNGTTILNKEPINCTIDTIQNKIELTLTQEETALFTYYEDINKNIVSIQIKMLTNEGKVIVSAIIKERVEDVLNDTIFEEEVEGGQVNE